MASSREIKRRIKSVTNIEQITKAMKMVAAARLRKAQERANSSKPYAQKIAEVLARVAAQSQKSDHPLLARREVKNIAYLVIGSDKGLAGAYNTNVMKEAVAQVNGHDNAHLITAGRKARDYFSHRNYKIDQQYSGFSERPSYQNAIMLANDLSAKFQDGTYDEICVVYTQFHSPLVYTPTTVRILPVEAPEVEATGDMGDEYIFEPSAPEILERLVPRYVETMLYATLMQSAASELGARMAAMSAATDNAKDLISELTLNYNKVRQAGITREITEIVGGAEALK